MDNHAEGIASSACRAEELNGEGAKQYLDDIVFDPSLAFLDEMEGVPLEHDGLVVPNPQVDEMINQAEELLRDMVASPDESDAVSSQTTRNQTPWGSKTKADSRVRRKEEIAYLRQQVEELETKLNQVKKQKKIAPQEDEVVNNRNSAAWKELADRQRHGKQRAEMENLKLREMLEDQLKIAYSLEKLLTKRMANAHGNWKQSSALAPLEHSDAIFQGIKQSLISNPVQVDALMHESGLDQIQRNFKDVKSECGDRDDLFLELTGCREVPFPLQTTGNAVWHVVNTLHSELHNSTVDPNDLTGSICYIRFNVTQSLRRADVSMDVYIIMQREEQQDRVVFTWKARAFLTSSTFRGHKVSLREYGYIVIERDPAQPESSSLIKWCVRSWPEVEGTAPTNRQFEFIVDVFLDSYHDNIQPVFDAVENKLLDDARAKSD